MTSVPPATAVVHHAAADSQSRLLFCPRVLVALSCLSSSSSASTSSLELPFQQNAITVFKILSSLASPKLAFSHVAILLAIGLPTTPQWAGNALEFLCGQPPPPRTPP